MKKFFAIAAMALLTLSASAQKIARVNFSELVQLMPEADKARETMSAASKEADETYKTMVEEFQSKYQQYQQKAKDWTASIRESKERELSDMQQRIQDFQQSVSQELQEQQSTLMAPIYQKAQEEVQKIAKEQGIDVLLDSTGALYFSDAIIDITAQARKALGIKEGRTLEQLQQELAAQQQQQEK